MDLDLDGKIALVTGSSRSIGAAIAATLRTEGCTVIVNGRDPRTTSAAAANLGASPVAGDVSSEAGARAVIDAAVKMHGPLDILVCNVGSGTSVPPGHETEAEWQRVLAINLYSAINSVAAARGHFKPQASIVCISSICGGAALGAPIAYSAAKAALNSYVRGAARYLANEGVRINALAPGNIMFPGSSWESKVQKDAAGVAAMLQSDVPLNRFGTAQEVADMATFLCSPRSGFATGAVYVLDGGQLRA